MAHLTRCAVWNDPACSITYFDDRDMAKYGFTDEDAFIAWYTNRLTVPGGIMAGFSYTLINSADRPSGRTHRNEWSLVNGKVVVDQDKVAQKEARKAARLSVLSKLKITEEEWATVKKL